MAGMCVLFAVQNLRYAKNSKYLFMLIAIMAIMLTIKVKSYLQRHVKSHDPGSKKYECDICGDKFTRPYLVLQHQEFTHRKNLPFKCSECGKCLRSKTFLKIHMRSVHSKEKPFPCEVCGFRSSRVDNLNIHRIKVHNLTTKVILRLNLCRN